MQEQDRENKIEALRKELFILEHTFICQQCGKEFLKSHKGLFCSDNCRNKYNYEHMSEERKVKQKQASKKYRQKKSYLNYVNQEIPNIYYSTEKTYPNF